MRNSGRKRVVSSCIPCYTRKQKCNREYPCNHCTRRRRPEECAYHPNQGIQIASVLDTRRPSIQSVQSEREPSECTSYSLRSWTDVSSQRSPVSASLPDMSMYRTVASDSPRSAPSLNILGYSEASNTNTLALIQKGWEGEEYIQVPNRLIAQNMINEVQRNTDRLPDRQILDFLVRYFVAEVNWVDQLIYPPWLLQRYQQWWNIQRLDYVPDIEFAVLVLRVCSYASQLLPSPSYTLDRVRGMLLTDIRDVCDDIAHNLAVICNRFDGQGSLLRVQHLTLQAITQYNEGRPNEFWDSLAGAIYVAHSLGLPDVATTSEMSDFSEYEQEMRRRTFCSLYALENLRSRQLDRVSLLPERLKSAAWPRARLTASDSVKHDPDAPDELTERFLQARLSDFWKAFEMPRHAPEYDMVAAEERYERFCTEFLPSLPSAFALTPNTVWDGQLLKLPLQRQLLHITLYDSLCWNFRLVLFHETTDLRTLPAHKQVLITSQRKALAVAALRTLDGVTTLHAMLGGCHTRLSQLVCFTFEAAVTLAYLCIDVCFPDLDPSGMSSPTIASKADEVDLLRSDIPKLTRNRCLQSLQDALGRLNMLAEVSPVAEASAHVLYQLLHKVTNQQDMVMEKATTTPDWSSVDHWTASTFEESFCGTAIPHDVHHFWPTTAGVS